MMQQSRQNGDEGMNYATILGWWIQVVLDFFSWWYANHFDTGLPDFKPFFSPSLNL